MPIFHLTFIEAIITLLAITHIVIVLVTVYFHRAMAHRSIILGKKTEAVFRFLSWFFLGMHPKEFAAVHRKHHAFTDKAEDPHSPVIYGVWGVLFKGLKLYRKEASNLETMNKYGQGFSNSKLEQFYTKHSSLGIFLFGILITSLLGWSGLVIWTLTLAWIPFWAAGVVNGLGHALGYRRFKTEDKSTNLLPIGIWIGGEELHNNHHARPTSPKFSSAWYEFDLGWVYIKIMIALGCATLRVPLVKDKKSHSLQESFSHAVEGHTIKAILNDRYYFLRTLEKACKKEIKLMKKTYKHMISEKSEHVQERLKALNNTKERFISIWKERLSVDLAISNLKEILQDAHTYNFENIKIWSHTLR
jgi:stearoyl-CoA desaturase (Delta-9 desaturase)